jgi:hypothetical protein
LMFSVRLRTSFIEELQFYSSTRMLDSSIEVVFDTLVHNLGHSFFF